MAEKEYKLDNQESKILMDMVNDVLDRGMISTNADTNKIEHIIEETTDSLGYFSDDVEFEISIKVKSK